MRFLNSKNAAWHGMGDFARLAPGIKDSKFLPLCFIAFIAIRLLVVVLIPVAEPTSDAGWYFHRALTIIEEGSYSEQGVPTAFWPVGYPAFIALVFKLAGPSLIAVRAANLLLAAASFWLLYLVVLEFLDDELAARGAVLLLTLYPNNVAYAPLILTETLYTFLLLLGSFALFRSRIWPHIAFAGCVFGLATLVKTQTVLFIPVLSFLAFLDRWQLEPVGKALVRAFVVTSVAVAVVLPWSLRNYIVFGSWVFVSTNGGIALLAGNNPSVVGDYRHDFSEDDSLVAQANFSVKDQVEADRRARMLAYTWIRENPSQFIKLIPKKLFRLWAPDGEAEWGYQDTDFYQSHLYWFRAARWINQMFYLGMLGLCAVAVGALIRTKATPHAYYGVAVIVVVSFTSIVFSGQSRYHYPAMPFVLAHSAWLLTRVKNPSS